MILSLGFAHAFGPAVLLPGQTAMQSHQTTLDLALDVTLLGSRHRRKLERVHTQKCQLEQLEQGIQVAWTENRHQATEPGHAHDRELPVVGHAYTLVGEALSRDDGGEPSAEERGIVERMTLPNQLQSIRAMLGPAPEPGATLKAGAMFAGVLDDAPGEPTLEHGTLTFLRVEQQDGLPVGIFAVDLHLRSEGDDDRSTHIVTVARGVGELHLEVGSGLTRLFVLQGSVTVDAKRPDLSTHGTGTFSTRTELRYR